MAIQNLGYGEPVFRIGIKNSEIPYIKKRIEDSELGEYHGEALLREFTEYLGKGDDLGMGEIMTDSYCKEYEKIRDEVLAKRNHKTCPFCKEVTEDLKKHIREYHREEVVLVYDELVKDDINKMRKEIILDNLG